MGWCSATIIFDSLCEALLDEPDDIDKKKLLKRIITILWDNDWDCEWDSAYLRDPMVKEAFIELDDRWIEYYREMKDEFK